MFLLSHAKSRGNQTEREPIWSGVVLERPEPGHNLARAQQTLRLQPDRIGKVQLYTTILRPGPTAHGRLTVRFVELGLGRPLLAGRSVWCIGLRLVLYRLV